MTVEYLFTLAALAFAPITVIVSLGCPLILALMTWKVPSGRYSYLRVIKAYLKALVFVIVFYVVDGLGVFWPILNCWRGPHAGECFGPGNGLALLVLSQFAWVFLAAWSAFLTMQLLAMWVRQLRQAVRDPRGT